MITIFLSAWLGYAIPLVAFIALVIGGYFLGRWIFKIFLPKFFHEGERKWEEPE